MVRMAQYKVLIWGLQGLGAEIAKNVILAGVKQVTLFDPEPVQWTDLASQFYLSPDHIGQSRARACLESFQELNPYVTVDLLPAGNKESIDENILAGFNMVVMVNAGQRELQRVNELCAARDIQFLATANLGLYGYVFADYGNEFSSMDPDGEQAPSGVVVDLTQSEDGLVSTDSDQAHEVRENDVVQFVNVEGMEEVNDRWFTVRSVPSPHSFTIGDTREFSPYVRGGYYRVVKQPVTVQHRRLEAFLEDRAEPTGVMNPAHFNRPAQLHALTQALWEFQNSHEGKLPTHDTDSDAVDDIICRATAFLPDSAGELSDEDRAMLHRLATVASGDLNPMCAALGGVAAQEVLKASGKKFTPLSQWLYLDAAEALPSVPSAADRAPCDTRYDGQVLVFGREFQEKLGNLHYFVVGAGALGCEFLKNFACMGIGCGPRGKVTVTDMDSIERSNLNRQFLFRMQDVGQPKSTTAAHAAQRINPELRVEALEEKVAPDTEGTFHDEFWSSIDGVCNALDNVAARLYVDQRCVEFGKSLLESGTLGSKCSTQVIVPGKSVTYGMHRDPPEESIPVCTLKSFPHLMEHTIEWAKQVFHENFEEVPQEVALYLSRDDFLTQLQHQRNSMVPRLRSLHPLDKVDKDGEPFWTAKKRPPTPETFDWDDPLHREFIKAAANIFASMYNIPQFVEESAFLQALETVEVPPYVPSGEKIAADEDEAKELEQEATAQSDDMEEEFERLRQQLPRREDLAERGFRMCPQAFEKDNDDNFHVDFITAAANIRARQYRIPTEDRLQVKRTVGRIIPAIATTTALTTGLIGMELCKLEQHVPLESYAEANINLAINQFAFFEPQPCPQRRVRGKVHTVWDFIDLAPDDDGVTNLQEFLDHFEEQELEVVMVATTGQAQVQLYNGLPGEDDEMEKPLHELWQDVTGMSLPHKKQYLIFNVSAESLAEEDEAEDAQGPQGATAGAGGDDEGDPFGGNEVELPLVRWRMPS